LRGWQVVGTSGTRPPSSDVEPHCARRGAWHFDTVLSAWIVFDGQRWRDPLTGAAV
jgi:hypothetical protein